jgi:beta-lactamase regulating signal transducer with metallopeptidase domain
MLSEVVLTTLLKAHLAAGAAVLLVLAIRSLARPLIGACHTYALWILVPVAATTTLFPSLAEFRGLSGAADLGLVGQGRHATALVLAWLAGVAVSAALTAAGEVRFRRLIRRGLAGPAVVGALWPRLVTPADFEARFTPDEQALIRRHERMHVARRDPMANLAIAAAQALGWFNPLIHVAARCARLDQEAACDAAVVEHQPGIRRAYAEALLKAQLSRPGSALACAFGGFARHPLETRIRLLARPPLGLREYLARAGLVGALAVSLALALWAAAPQAPLQAGFDWSSAVHAGA